MITYYLNIFLVYITSYPKGFIHRVLSMLFKNKKNSHKREILQIGDSHVRDSELMLKGVIRIKNMIAKEVMIPVSKMDMIDISWKYEEILNTVIRTSHSRFPMYDKKKNNIIGFLMIKDLLKLQISPDLNIRVLIRPSLFVPESKNLRDLLREFRIKRNHMAIVIDEFGFVSGLITIENILEEIVGSIDDEFDTPETECNIFNLVNGSYRVSGYSAIEEINAYFKINLDTKVENCNTIGGLISHIMGHVPKKGEGISIQGFSFVSMHNQRGFVRWFRVERG